MSVTVCWAPVPTTKTDRSFKRNAGSSKALEILSNAFGSIIQERDIPALRAVAIAIDMDFFNEVAELVEKHGSIEVYGRY